MKFETAAVLVPSNSFLKGEIDFSEALTKLSNFFKCIGYELKRISILEENDETLACELDNFTKLFDVVIILLSTKTQCVSRALSLVTLQELIELIDEGTCSSEILKAHTSWPESTKLLKSQHSSCPVVYLQRMFIIASDSVDEQLNFIMRKHLVHYWTEPVFSKVFHITLNGSKKKFESIQSDKLNVTLGKITCDKEEQDILTLAASNFETIVNGEIFLQNSLGIDILDSCWINQMTDLIYQSEDKHIKGSIEVIEKCLGDYGAGNVFLSFNGGKDCTVLLHLVQTVLHKKYPSEKGQRKLFCLYVRSDNAFKEQDEFIEQCMIFYNLEIMTVNANIKDALRITLGKRPHLKACFMGTRRTDPYSSHLGAFQMTDSDWPEVMRCSPFLDWHFSDIWDYLLYYKVPYCKLYDYGFTSLGNATNTIRNPSLLYSDGDKEVYLPAYKMLKEKKERSGRNVSKM